MAKMKAHVFVICWPNVRDNVVAICEALGDLDCRKTVIDKSRTLPDDLPGWECIQISDKNYFGMQMELAFRLFDGDIFISITGDAMCDDWKSLIKTAIERFETIPYLGVWSPEIDHTGWGTERVSLGHIDGTELFPVCQTDSIVWAVKEPIVEKLRLMDYTVNNFGWGIDWAAVVLSYCSNHIAVRDHKVRIHHPVGKSYSPGDADVQMVTFLNQLGPHERTILTMLNRSVGINFKTVLPTPSIASY